MDIYPKKRLCETDFTSPPKFIALSDDDECESETFHHSDRPMMQSTPIKSVPSSSMKATKREQSESNEHGVKVLYTYTLYIYIYTF